MILRVKGKVATIAIAGIKHTDKGDAVSIKFTNNMNKPPTESNLIFLAGDSIDLSGTIDITGTAWEFIKAIILRRPVNFK